MYMLLVHRARAAKNIKLQQHGSALSAVLLWTRGHFQCRRFEIVTATSVDLHRLRSVALC